MGPEYLNQFNAFAILQNNGHEHGFNNCVLVGSPISNDMADPKSCFVFYGYDYKNQIEQFEPKNNSPLKFCDSYAFSVEKIHTPESITLNKSSVIIPQQNIAIKSLVSKESYLEKVKQLKQHIQQGDIYEINYCITFEADNINIDPIEVYQKLNSINQSPFSALVKINNNYIISSSPELFLSKKGNKIFTKPIKGTVKRSSVFKEDERLKSELLNSLKERTENVMIVDVARNDLSRIAKKGSVKVDKLYDIESYEQVHQMVSTVSCELKDGVTFKDIIHATFPMASMTGAPKIRAMQLIDEFEIYNRGPFSGCIGYIDENGDFDLNVLIRSIFYNASEKYLSFSVGSAITAMCDPEKEYEECLLKAAAMMKALSN